MNCERCVYYPKCDEKPFDETGCPDFKDGEMFVELPFLINQQVYYINPATKYVPVIIDGAAYFKLEDDSKVESHLFSCEDLQKHLEPILPFQARNVRQYFATKEEAEKALAERVKKNG
jgi:hypothetical protein